MADVERLRARRGAEGEKTSVSNYFLLGRCERNTRTLNEGSALSPRVRAVWKSMISSIKAHAAASAKRCTKNIIFHKLEEGVG